MQHAPRGLLVGDYCVDGFRDVDTTSRIFWENGFVGIENAFSDEFARRLYAAAEDVALEQMASDQGAITEAREHWSYVPYYAGKNQVFAELINLPELFRLLEDIGLYDYVPAKVGGEFTLENYTVRQDLHSDFGSACPFRSWMADPSEQDLPIHDHYPPVVAVSFIPADLDAYQAPTRIVPWPKCDWGLNFYVDDADACFFAMRAGTIIIRDVRVPHSGTENLATTPRFQPALLLVSQRYIRATAWRPQRCIPSTIWYDLEFFIKVGSFTSIDALCRWSCHEECSQWRTITSALKLVKDILKLKSLCRRFNGALSLDSTIALMSSSFPDLSQSHSFFMFECVFLALLQQAAPLSCDHYAGLRFPLKGGSAIWTV